jgi:hypothetical protein
MRHLILPTCLVVSAWAYPADLNRDHIAPLARSHEVAAVDKTVPATPAPQPVKVATADVKTDNVKADDVRADEVVTPIPDATPPETGNGLLAAAGDALARLDAEATAIASIWLGFRPPVPKPEPVRLPPRRPVPHEIVCEALAGAAVSNDVPAPFLIRLLWQESGFNQNAVSPVGAQGVAQFMPAVASERNLADPFDPLQAVHASARLLRELVKQFGNLGLAAAAYNAGPKRVQDWLDKKGSLPQETRDYVERVTGQTAEHWRTASAGPMPHLPAAAPCQREAGLLAANGPAEIPMPPQKMIVVAKNEPTKNETAKNETAKSEAKKDESKAPGSQDDKPATAHAKHADPKHHHVKLADAGDEPEVKVVDKTAKKTPDKDAGKPSAKVAAKAGHKATVRTTAKVAAKIAASDKPAKADHHADKPLHLAARKKTHSHKDASKSAGKDASKAAAQPAAKAGKKAAARKVELAEAQRRGQK